MSQPSNESSVPFAADSQTGIISTQAVLDREHQAQYTVVVVAQDLGRPPQLTSRVLVINVTDADDNDPVFLKRSVRPSRLLGGTIKVMINSATVIFVENMDHSPFKCFSFVINRLVYIFSSRF